MRWEGNIEKVKILLVSIKYLIESEFYCLRKINSCSFMKSFRFKKMYIFSFEKIFDTGVTKHVIDTYGINIFFLYPFSRNYI